MLSAAALGDDNCKLLLAVDEAQLLYDVKGSGSQQFFTALKELEQGRCNVRVLLAAAYGYGYGTSSGIPTDDPGLPVASPNDWESRVITIHPGRVSLQLDPEEVDELWGAWKRVTALQLDDAVKRHIAALCASQVLASVGDLA